MLSTQSLPCFDAGSEYCPCILAGLGQCISCSMLRGKDTCDCGWNGICVFSEFVRAGKKVSPGRQEVQAPLINLDKLNRPGSGHRAYLARICVPSQLAAWSMFPGAFVLLRPQGTQERFNVPVSVMEVSDRSLTIAIEVCGPKTIALEHALLAKQNLTLTGPFWSGLQGYSQPVRRAHKNTIIVAKGIAQAAVPAIARYIRNRGGNLKAFIGPGTLGTIFIDNILESLDVPFEILPRTKDHNLGQLEKQITKANPDLIISAGSKLQHRGILDLLAGPSRNQEAIPHFLWVSHLTMTCAEGICGSCLLAGFRGCKAQFDHKFNSYLLEKTV